MQLAEQISFWTAVVLYATGFGLFVLALVLKKTRFAKPAVWACSVAFTMHTMSLVVRWIDTGHPPYVTFFESVSASAWFGVLAYIILRQFRHGFALVGLGVTGAVFILLGWASTPSYAGEVLPADLRSVWLFIHATFATAGLGMFLVAAGISVLWLWCEKRNGIVSKKFGLPSNEIFDETTFRYVLVGFLFWTVMLLSGAIWANNAWGRYWGWDPIETWSLICWLVYALFIHLHFTFRKLRGVFTAWYTAIAVLVAAFSLWGVGYVYKTIHTYG